MPSMTEEEIDSYVSGKCMYLAAALHRQYGWEIRVAMEDHQGPDAYIGHAWCVEPKSGHCVDIDGMYPHDINGWIHPGAKVIGDMNEDSLRHLTLSTGGYPFDTNFWETAIVDAQSVISKYLAPKIAEALA